MAAALAGCGGRTTIPAFAKQAAPRSAAAAPAPTTPQDALARLTTGNARWVSGQLQHPDRDPTRRQLVASSQAPFAVILSCIDSRVPPELVFDTGLGDLYVMRTGGQTVGPVVTGSVEYGPLTGGTPLIMVLGHQRCGAVAAAFKALRDGKALPGNLQAIADALRPAYKQITQQRAAQSEADQIEAMTKAQVELTSADLEANADLAPLVSEKALAVVGAYYSLDTGQVQVLTPAPS